MLRVLTPPDPIVEPWEIPGSHADDNPVVMAMIEAATMAIDGPTGWVGRAFGEQTLELAGDSFYSLSNPRYGIPLPCPPIIEVEGVFYLGTDGVEVEYATENWRFSASAGSLVLTSGTSWPTAGDFDDAVRIVYRAGYDGDWPDSGGTGEIPAQAKQAIILSVQHLINMGASSAFLQSETVEGIGQKRYAVTPEAGSVIRNATDALLRGLWIPRV